MPDPTDGKEASAAVERSRRRLAAARAREPWTVRVERRLLGHLERNHFSESLDEAFGRPHREGRDG